MYTTYSQHFFVLGICIKLLQQQQQPQFLTKSTPPIFFSYTQYILHYLLIGFIEEVFKECNDNLLNSYIYI